MPHRLPLISYTFANLCEFTALVSLAVLQGVHAVVNVLTEADWQKAFGPNGVAFVSVLATIILWGTFLRYQGQQRKDNIAREAREDARRDKEGEARERRHNDLIASNAKNAEDLKALTVESIKAQMIVANESKAHANNAQLLSINIHNLCELLKKSPCLATMKLRDEAEITISTDSRL